MSVLLDTGVLYAFLNKSDPRHEEAATCLRRIARGEWGAPVVTEHIVDELLTLIRFRKCPLQVEEAAHALLPLDGPSRFHLRIALLGPSGLGPAAERYRQHRDRRLSFTDATHLVVMERLHIAWLATFDSGFDGLVPIVPV